jgi:hypothetical protein
MHRKAVLLFILFLFFSINASLMAQRDPGIPDTVRVDSVQIDPAASPVIFSVEVTLFNDEKLGGASLGLYYDSDDIEIDSVSLVGGAAEHLPNLSFASPDTNLAAVGFYWPGTFFDFVSAGDSLLATLWFTLAANAPDQTINIDSGYFPPGGDFVLTDSAGNSLKPQFKAGKVVVGEGTPPQPEISLNPTSFTFNAEVGGSNPTPEVLNIVNVGDGNLNWTASWNSSWLTVSPSSGTAPSNPSVSVNIFGMTAGTYEDTITISDPNAVNSPQFVPVTLELIDPPPEIELVPDNFYFIAVQDGTNPPNQQMTINDVGGGTLSWTASNSSTWLTLSSYAGGPGETIDLIVDITGLSYGFYYDTIVVSDPEASNSPQLAEVVLELVSSFPVLETSPDSFVVAGSVTEDPYDHILKVINGGGGSMNYTLTADQPWISFNPQTGSTPDTADVLVTFHSTGLPLGFQYATITVSSDNASESPQEIDVQLWVMENPPALGVSTNSLDFIGFQCQNIPPIPSQSFDITNPSPNDLVWSAEWDASWLSLAPTSGYNAQTVNVFVDEVGLEAGTYIDTIKIDAVWSTTPSTYVEVSFTLTENPIPPELTLSTDFIEFIFLAGEVGVASAGKLHIGNAISGCIDWYITDTYPWLNFDKTSGSTPDSVIGAVNGGGLPLGITPGQFTVHAPGSSNDSIVVNFNVYIAQLGDANCDGKINMSDVVYIINYIFAGGPAPVPRIWAGDVNCDLTCNIEDAVWLVSYIFSIGLEICQYKPLINPNP